MPDFQVANLIRDRHLLEAAKREAAAVVAGPSAEITKEERASARSSRCERAGAAPTVWLRSADVGLCPGRNCPRNSPKERSIAIGTISPLFLPQFRSLCVGNGVKRTYAQPDYRRVFSLQRRAGNAHLKRYNEGQLH